MKEASPQRQVVFRTLRVDWTMFRLPSCVARSVAKRQQKNGLGHATSLLPSVTCSPADDAARCASSAASFSSHSCVAEVVIAPVRGAALFELFFGLLLYRPETKDIIEYPSNMLISPKPVIILTLTGAIVGGSAGTGAAGADGCKGGADGNINGG